MANYTDETLKDLVVDMHNDGLHDAADCYRMAWSAQRRYNLSGNVQELILRDHYIEEAQNTLAGRGWSGRAILLRERGCGV